MSSEQEHVIQLGGLSSTHPSPDRPIGDRYPKSILRKTANGYIKLFKVIIQKYTECSLRIQSPAFASESSSVMIDTYNSILDTERLVANVLTTQALRNAWRNLVRRYGELGDYEDVHHDDACNVILAVCREWEYSGLNGKGQPSSPATKCLAVNEDLPLSANKAGKARSKHGMRNTPEYRAWCNMRSRCSNPKAKGYRNYGGRGIKVAPEFEDFETFLSHVGLRPGPEYSLDRIDNDGDYAPGNVRWILRKNQNANRRHPSEWPSKKLKAAAREAKRDAFLATKLSSQRSFDEKYRQAVMEREDEIALVDLIDWLI